MSAAVLLNIDDNEAARYARTKILQQAGFVVHDAANGTDGLRLVAELKPDLVLLDVHLPDIHGIEVCRRIKGMADGIATIVLQISASASTVKHATAALNTGADSYLMEPVDSEVLVATVRALLRLRSAERAFAVVNQELSEKNAKLNTVNQALVRSNEDLKFFAYVASHDLQEPLRNITTHLELIQRRIAGQLDETVLQLFSVVQDGARRMGLLIRDVLTYSGISNEAPPLNPVELKEALAWALQNLSETTTASGASITVGDLPVLCGDIRQLGQVFQNLIGNSIKYRTPGARPEVSIDAERDSAGKWIVRVRDNGIGIGPDHLEKIFYPFKRLHGSEIPGSGIGLALCRRIIEGHGGQIWVESTEGEGSTFFFTLPPVEDCRAEAAG